MKKIALILVINLILLLFFVANLEAQAYKKTIKANQEYIGPLAKREGHPFRLKQVYSLPKKFNYDEYKYSLRPVNYRMGNKKPIVFFGCSFTEGFGLTNKQTLAYKIAVLTNRTTYNRGVNGTGPQFMYYQLNDKNFKNEAPESDCIIYIFIWDHLSRLHKYQLSPFINNLSLRYKIVDNELVEAKPVFAPLSLLYTVKQLQYNSIVAKVAEEETNYKLFNLTMAKSMEIAQKKYPHSKFVILEYPDTHNKKFSQAEVLKLESMGFIVINAEKLIGHSLVYENFKKYRVQDGYHPSEFAWNEIAPKLARELNL